MISLDILYPLVISAQALPMAHSPNDNEIEPANVLPENISKLFLRMVHALFREVVKGVTLKVKEYGEIEVEEAILEVKRPKEHELVVGCPSTSLSTTNTIQQMLQISTDQRTCLEVIENELPVDFIDEGTFVNNTLNKRAKNVSGSCVREYRPRNEGKSGLPGGFVGCFCILLTKLFDKKWNGSTKR